MPVGGKLGKVEEGLIQAAQAEYHTKPGFVVQMVVVSGILRWNYQIQVYADQ